MPGSSHDDSRLRVVFGCFLFGLAIGDIERPAPCRIRIVSVRARRDERRRGSGSGPPRAPSISVAALVHSVR